LPILHLNGYKISNPTILARIEQEELEQFLQGCGWTPYFVEGDEPEKMHQLMAAVLDQAIEGIRQIQSNARNKNDTTRPRWPMIVLRSPKGWTGPKFVDDLQVEGTFRAHQVPLLVDYEHPEHLKQLESWMKSYKPEEFFDESGRFRPELAELAPKGERRMGANPQANGGILLRDLRLPDFQNYAVNLSSPGTVDSQDTFILGKYLRDVTKLNQDQRNFRIFGPDETLSNLLGAAIWALFTLLYCIFPGILYKSVSEYSVSHIPNIGECISYSIATFLTIGFGNITPLTSLAVILSGLEGFSGVFLTAYFTVAFARKVLG